MLLGLESQWTSHSNRHQTKPQFGFAWFELISPNRFCSITKKLNSYPFEVDVDVDEKYSYIFIFLHSSHYLVGKFDLVPLLQIKHEQQRTKKEIKKLGGIYSLLPT